MKLLLLGAVVALLLGWLVYGWLGAEERASRALARADSVAQENARVRVQQQADSMALGVARATHAGELAQIAQERAQARQDARRASLAAQGASESLRHTLDSLGASTAALDSMEAAHADEVVALKKQVAVADSATASALRLLYATEKALESEQALRRGVDAERAALAVAVDALQSSRRRERWVSSTTLALVIGIAVLR